LAGLRPGIFTSAAVVGPTVWPPTEYVKVTRSPPRASVVFPVVATSRWAVTVRPTGVPAASSCKAAGSGACQAWVQVWSEAGAPTRPVLPTPSTLKVSLEPSNLRSLPAFTVTLVLEAGSCRTGGWPTKPVLQEDPMTVHVVAGAKQYGPVHGAQLTSHPPRPLAFVVTKAGAPGPWADVVKARGSDWVDWPLT
jgi:hypothetical protein